MKTNYLKLGVLGLMMMVGTAVNAQTTDASTANTTQAQKAGESIRLIDNKGTIKYMQSNNGITTITSTAANNRTTTTWQLGGSLLENTYIDVDGKAFALDGLALIDPLTEAASTDATDGSDHGTGTGWTLLVRDEATGETKKMMATDLVQSGSQDYTATAADETGNSGAFAVNGMPASASKVWVYRNGARLRPIVDYTLTAGNVTLVTTATAPNDWAVYEGDIFEVQWVK